MVDGKRPPSTYIPRMRAEVMVAKGICTWANSAMRAVYERCTRPRGDFREWRKTVSGTRETGYVHTMQLVPLGRPRGKRSHS